jgi:hypothetical protein
VIFRAEGFGIVSTGGRFTLGYVNAEYALLPVGDCRIVIWLDGDARPQALDAVRGLGEPVCFAGPGAPLETEEGD